MTRTAAAAAIAAAALTVPAVTGCNATRRELTVVFDVGVSDQQRAAVLHACAGAAPRTSPEPVVTPTPHPGRPVLRLPVRFRIDHADDRDIARLEQCLQRQPGVVGFQDSAAD